MTILSFIQEHWGAVLLALSPAAILAWLILRAPDGWQDEAGFHFGSPHDRIDSEAYQQPTSIADAQVPGSFSHIWPVEKDRFVNQNHNGMNTHEY